MLLISLLFAMAVSLIPASSQAQPSEAPLIQSGSDLLAAVNSLRSANGLPPYIANSILMQIAQAQADYMAATGGAYGHTGPGGTRPIDRAVAAGYPAQFFSENWQAGGGLSPSGAVSAWQGDAPHLNTMLSSSLVDAGAGVSKSGGTVYYVLDAGAIGSSGGSASEATAGTSVPAGTVQPSQFMVPVTLSTPDADGLVYHEVAYGQSLWSIAIAYGTKIEDIKALNNISGLDIYPGQKLLILRGPTPAPATPTLILTATSSLAAARPTASTVPAIQAIAATSAVTPVATPAASPPQKNRLSLTAIAIVGVALLFAAMATWIGTRRPV
jgi:uncharacterized protein YkwD